MQDSALIVLRRWDAIFPTELCRLQPWNVYFLQGEIHRGRAGGINERWETQGHVGEFLSRGSKYTMFFRHKIQKSYTINVISWKQCKINTLYYMLLTRSDMQLVDYRHLRWSSVVVRVSRLLQNFSNANFRTFRPAVDKISRASRGPSATAPWLAR